MGATAVTIDMHPMWVDLEPAMPMLEGYEQAEDDRKVYACIASYVNSQGIAWPTYRNIMHKTGLALQRVKRSVWRLVFKNLLAIPRKEKKKNDIHPRNIYQINKDFLRQDPDTRSSHFDAEKWKPFAARLKKYVSKAVDKVKQVAVDAAENMSARKRKPRKQWKQNYQRSYGSYAEPVLTPEELERKHWIQQLIQQAENDLSKTDIRDGYYLALRYTADHVKKTPEQYDQILQDAIAKFKDYVEPDPMEAYEQDANGHWWLKKSYKSHVPDVRLMSSEDEPTTLGGILGAAFA